MPTTPITTLASAEQYAAWAAGVGITSAAPSNLADLLASATAQLQQYCNREFLPSPADPDEAETRTYYGDGGVTLYIADALTLDSVAVGSTALSADCYRAVGVPVEKLEYRPSTGFPSTDNYPSVYPRGASGWAAGAAITVTGRFGYAEQAALPADLVEACCALAALRALDGASWQNLGVKSVQAGAIAKVEYAQDGTQVASKRESALALVNPYRRLY